MAEHDDLLAQGPREAPEPETAEERTARRGRRAAGGGLLGGGVAAAKLGAIGGLGKALIWIFAWHGVVDAGHVFGWIGIIVAVGALATYLALRHRRVTA